MGFIDTEHQGGWSMWGSKTAHLMVAGRERERERELKLHVQHYPICGKIYSWKTCWKKIYQGVYGGYLWIV
jgi:hypothetical protein